MRKAIGLIMLAVLALVANTAAAQDFPALTGRVVDQADLLDPAQEAALSAKLEGLESRTNRQLVVATLSSLQGYDISDYGYQLGRKWRIGQDGSGENEKDNGAILIVAPNERKVRIEVGYGLEPVLTDGYSSTVIRNVITPRFKTGDMAGGINAGVDTIITQLELPPDQAAKIAAAANRAQRSQGYNVDIGTIITWLFIFFFVILPLIRSLFGKRGRRFGGGPVIIWGPGLGGGSSSSWGSGGGSSWGGGGGFSGGGGSFGGGGASGSW